MSRFREVRKRDNRIVPFDVSKIADAIYRALRSVGEGSRSLAEELASAVSHFLDERFEGAVPGIEDIQDQVETVLMEMGHPRVAKAYILYRQKRALLRQTLEVRKVSPREEGVTFDYEEAEVADAGGGLPEVEETQWGTSTWQKGKISAALIREADLDPDIAEEIASVVERKVLESGIRRIATTLIRELVDNELFERGFKAKLEKQAPIGLPKYNLEQIIFGTDSKEGYTYPKNPSEVREIIANRILHQYSLQEVFSPAVSDAHREGSIFIHRLSDPIRFARWRWSIPCPAGAWQGYTGKLPLGSAAEHAPGSYFDLVEFFRRLAHLEHFVSEEIRLSELPNLLLDPSSRTLRAPEMVKLVLDRLAEMGPRPDIALELDLNASSRPWLEGLLDLPRDRPRRFVLALRLGSSLGPESSELCALVAKLGVRGEQVEFLPPSGRAGRPVAVEPSWLGSSRFLPGSGSRLQEGASEGIGSRQGWDRGRGFSGAAFERQHEDAPAPGLTSAVLSKITLNLPRAAYRSGKDRRSSIESELEAMIDLAIKGHLERRQFVSRLAANRENPLWDLLGRSAPASRSGFRAREYGRIPAAGEDWGALLETELEQSYAIGLLGLNECVKYLTGRELHQDRVAMQKGLELVQLIHRKVRREERGLGISLALEETANVGPLKVLEQSDRRRHPEIVEIDRGRPAGAFRCYSDGVRLHRTAPMDPLRRLEELSPFLAHVYPQGGIMEAFPELKSPDCEVLLSLLEECLPLLAAK
jgi:hypothetical protein